MFLSHIMSVGRGLCTHCVC